MKRIDLHIHTLSTPLDDDFDFDIESIKRHVSDNQLDIIAITNHNVFDKSNYLEVCKELPNILVLPGIEVSVEGYHVLVVAKDDEIDAFAAQCSGIKPMKQSEQGIATEEFVALFGGGDHLVIPHYRKKPSIREPELQKIAGCVSALEVSSQKKWATESKDSALPIVIFSDYRCRMEKVPPLGHYTYVDVADATFDALKLSFKDKSKFSITQKRGMLELAPGLYASKGLNVVIGGRSSGKTYLLDSIQKSYDANDIVYVRQFGIVQDAADEAFDKIVEGDEASIKSDYYRPMKRIAEHAMELPAREDADKELKDYIQRLVDYAESTSLDDEFSKCKIYQSQPMSRIDLEPYKKVVQAILVLLGSNPLESEIDSIVGRDALIKLLRCALDACYEAKKKDWCIGRANDLLRKTRTSLASKSSRPPCPESPLVDCVRRVAFVKRITALRSQTKLPAEIRRHSVGRFTSVAMRRDYPNATALKKALGIATGENLPGITNVPDEEYIETMLKKCDDASAFEKALFDVEISLKNDRCEDISGGQRAEYLFMRALDKAGSQDVVVIDEPESSFDNPFLYSTIAAKLKEISQRATVFVSTHNNVLGVSIQPDVLIYTSVDANEIHKVYAGHASGEALTAPDGSTVPREEALLSLMEAGVTAYNERKPYYGTLANG